MEAHWSASRKVNLDLASLASSAGASDVQLKESLVVISTWIILNIDLCYSELIMMIITIPGSFHHLDHIDLCYDDHSELIMIPMVISL